MIFTDDEMIIAFAWSQFFILNSYINILSQS